MVKFWISFDTIKWIILIFCIIKLPNSKIYASLQVAQQELQQQHTHDKIEQFSTSDDEIPLVRLPSNTLLKYTAYKDVSILHFRVPEDTKNAVFTFKAYEESKSAFQRVCQPRDITLHLKAGSYPVISPENITFPKHFLSPEQRYEIHSLQFQSDTKTHKLNIEGPETGNWFAVAFVSWTDPSNERIEQQGIAASCETLLLSEMSVELVQPIILTEGQLYVNKIKSEVNNTNEILFKIYIPRNIAKTTVKIKFPNKCIKCPRIVFLAQANALPNENKYIFKDILYVNENDSINLTFSVHSGIWHYINLSFEKLLENLDVTENSIEDLNEINFSIQFNWIIVDESNLTESNQPFLISGIEFYPLLRQTYREFFMFDYDLLPDINGTIPTLLNLTTQTTTGFKINVGDVYDIGGTLSFAIAMKDDNKEKDINKNQIILTDKLTNNNNNNNNNNQTIVICMHLGEPGIPKWPNSCYYGNKIFPAASIINNTEKDSSTGLIHVPFPESGTWYITMGIFCPGADTTARITIIDSVKDFIRKNIILLDNMKPPCSCANLIKYYRNCLSNSICLAQLNETETLKIKECQMDSKCVDNYNEIGKKFDIHHKFATEQSVATDGCNTSVLFTISSSPCVAGRCGRYGRCYHYMSGGFVFSTCLCLKGYRGWDCTEDSQVPTSFSILISSLLLILSNLLFIPSIYSAIYRKYYTESIIYFSAMFFSIFYHACDSGEDEYSFCLVKIGVLQFCDFYCGLLAIWVTLIAMAHIRQQFVSILHMFGAIVLAFGTELNKQSLWVFLAPALTGICIISISWGIKCHKTNKWFPSRKYLIIYMPIGIVLVMIGLICYAFLQTKQNYHIVHSIWHMVMALSILCLLPNRNSFLPKC